MMTKAVKLAHDRVEQRTLELAEWACTSGINRMEMGGTKIGIIADSTSYQYAKEVFGDEVSILKIGMVYPLPEKMIRDFASKVDELYVMEELDPIIETYVKSARILFAK